jgi:soluble P-type ATPase
MIEIDVPGFEKLCLQSLVCDYSGTLSIDGKLIEGVLERLNELSDNLDIYIITADTHGRAKKELLGVNCNLTKIDTENEHLKKEQFIGELGADNVIAIGNGSNDRKMLKVAKVGIAVCLDEGVSTRAVLSSDIVVNSIIDALDLLLKPNRLIATLRY